MALFKKPVEQVDNDENIRREIRARVAKQAGIYDEEYIKTGKIGGEKKEADNSSAEVTSHTSAAATSIIIETAKSEVELDIEPEIPVAETIEQTPPSKPIKEKKQKSTTGQTKKMKKKSLNITLILVIIVLILAFIPLYYFLGMI